MLLTNYWMSGEEAFRNGLVNQVVPRDKLIETAEEMAKKIVSYPPMAVRNAKQAVARGLDLTLTEGLNLEKRLASGLASVASQKADIGKGCER